jgi:hypothetical protein
MVFYGKTKTKRTTQSYMYATGIHIFQQAGLSTHIFLQVELSPFFTCFDIYFHCFRLVRNSLAETILDNRLWKKYCWIGMA